LKANEWSPRGCLNIGLKAGGRSWRCLKFSLKRSGVHTRPGVHQHVLRPRFHPCRVRCCPLGIVDGALGSRQAVHVLGNRPCLGTVATAGNIGEPELTEPLVWLPMPTSVYDAIVCWVARSAPWLAPSPFSMSKRIASARFTPFCLVHRSPAREYPLAV